MAIEITKNGSTPAPGSAMLGTSWTMEQTVSGRKHFKLYVIHVPLLNAFGGGPIGIGAATPRIAGAPTVIGEATMEVPNLEIARLLVAGISEMLAKQPPEIILAKPAG